MVTSLAPPQRTTRSLVVDSLSVTFGGLRALDDVSMSAHEGEIVGVIGPNGAGKTTLFNVICGFVRASSGVITYDGTSSPGQPPSPRSDQAGHRPDPARGGPLRGPHRPRERDGGCPEPPALRRRVCIARAVALVTRGTEHRSARADELLDELGVAAYRHALPGHAALLHPEADGTGPVPHGRAQPPVCSTSPPAAYPTTRWTTSAPRSGAPVAHGRPPRRAPHGPRHVGVRPAGGAELRPGHRRRDPRRRSDRIPRSPRPIWAGCPASPQSIPSARGGEPTDPPGADA